MSYMMLLYNLHCDKPAYEFLSCKRYNSLHQYASIFAGLESIIARFQSNVIKDTEWLN